MKKTISIVIVICMLVGCFSVGVVASDEKSAGNNSRYTGLTYMTAVIDISNLGRAVTSVDVCLRSGYTAELNAVLIQFDGANTSEIKEWNADITGDLGGAWAGVWYVESGYFYFTEVTVDIYDSNGKYIETVSLETNTEYYG